MNYFEIDEIEVFVDITPSTFNIANVSRGLSGVHWQQTILMGIVRKHPYPSYANSLNMYTLEFVTHFGWVENTPTYVSKICTYLGWVENRTSRKNTFMCRFWWWNDRSNSINYISHTSKPVFSEQTSECILITHFGE